MASRCWSAAAMLPVQSSRCKKNTLCSSSDLLSAPQESWSASPIRPQRLSWPVLIASETPIIIQILNNWRETCNTNIKSTITIYDKSSWVSTDLLVFDENVHSAVRWIHPSIWNISWAQREPQDAAGGVRGSARSGASEEHECLILIQQWTETTSGSVRGVTEQVRGGMFIHDMLI